MGRKGLLLVVGALLFVVLAAWWGMRAQEPASPALDGLAGERPAEATDKLAELAPEAQSEREQATQGLVQGLVQGELSTPTHRIFGRVVDQRRMPVAGAQVSLGRVSEAVASATSAQDGQFELLVELAASVVHGRDAVLARDGNGRKALSAVYLLVAKDGELLEVDAQTLVLLPAHPLSVRVNRGAAAPGGAKVRVSVGHERLLIGEFETDALGRLELADLPPGPVYLTAALREFSGRALAFVPEEREVTIELEPLGGIDVLVVDAESGAGIAGAELEVGVQYSVPAALPSEGKRLLSGEYRTSVGWEGSVRATDGEGRARIVGLATGVRYKLAVSAEGYESYPPRGASGARLKPGGEPVLVELKPVANRRVRWPVIAGEVPVPTPGAAIRLRRQAGSYSRGRQPAVPAPGRMEGSMLVVEGVVGRGSFIAQAPDGALARLWVEANLELGNQTSFRRARRIEVHVIDESGAPVVGAMVGARNQGNNPLCELVPTNALGDAVLEGLYGGLAEVSVLEPGETSLYGPTHGSVDLEQGDGKLEVTLEAVRHRRARLMIRIDGAPRLPARFELRNRSGAKVLEEFPARGELSLELALPRDEAAATVWLNAVGFASAEVEFAFADETHVPSVTLDLAATARLVALVLKPMEGYVSVIPQRFDAERQAWASALGLGVFNGLHQSNGPAGSFIFGGLTPGRWRVLDERSGVASTEAELLLGASEVLVILDLASTGWVSGRVEVDDPAELSRVRVVVEGAGAGPVTSWRPGSEPPKGAFLNDGEFRLRVPLDSDVTLVPWHPWLVPAADSGRVTLRGLRDGVVLRLVTGNELRLPVPQLSVHSRGLRVARFSAAAEPEGEPLEWHHAALVDGVLRCSLPHGRWTLLVEPGADFAPLELRRIEIDGVTELPPARFTQGSTLRVRVLTATGSDAPRIYVFAERLGSPAYHRDINSRGEREVLLHGLGPGRFRVKIRAVMGTTSGLEQEIELDGVGDLELEFDLR